MPWVKCIVCGREVWRKPSKVTACKVGNTCSRHCTAKLAGEGIAREKMTHYDMAWLALQVALGKTGREIGAELGCNASTANRIVRRERERLERDWYVATCDGCGAKFATRKDWDGILNKPKYFYCRLECSNRAGKERGVG